MIITTLDRLKVQYAAEPVFRDLSFEVHDDRVVGLVGPNGSGKTTLLRAIAGRIEPSAGVVARKSELRVGYLEQDLSFPAGTTIRDAIRQGARHVNRIDAELRRIEHQLTRPEVYDDDRALQRALHEQEALLAAYERAGGPGLEGRIRSLLRQLGFAPDADDRPVDVLSGGQRKLVGLASEAVGQPELLLLDEPDNHLDLAGKAYLQRFIRDYPGGVVLVSHDRYLLDLVVDEIVELEAGHLTRFVGNYSEYAIERERQRARLQRQIADQTKEIRRLEASAQRLMTWGKVFDNPKFSQRAKAILKRLDRIERLEAPPVPNRMRLALEGWRGSTKVIELQAVAKSYPGGGSNPADRQVVLDGVNMVLRHGERVGVVGPNGSGKTVLLRLLLGAEPPTGGHVIIGPSVRIGYYAQEHETLDPGRTLIDTLRYETELSQETAVRTLIRFGFSYRQAQQRVEALSGGERSRLQLARIMLCRPNLLLLDEPTNNLDIASAEILESALDGFDGTILAVSHDRYFLDRVVERIAELRSGRLVLHGGGYSQAVTQGALQGGLR
jgi:ATP-binding cassette subfamily F protein 3